MLAPDLLRRPPRRRLKRPPRAHLPDARMREYLRALNAQVDAARQLVRFFTSQAVSDIVRATGLDPVVRSAP